MAKTAKPKSKIQIAADKARETLKNAKDRDEKASNDTTKQAVQHAKDALAVAVKAENRERFLTLGGGRVGKILAGFDTLAQVANRKSYDFNGIDVSKAFDAIEAKLTATRAVFTTALQTAPSADKKAAPAAFKFE